MIVVGVVVENEFLLLYLNCYDLSYREQNVVTQRKDTSAGLYIGGCTIKQDAL